MRRSNPENESAVPRISPVHFTSENSARTQDTCIDDLRSMIEFADEWNVVGWALADDVMHRDMCAYVILFEKDGFRSWAHESNYTVDRIAEIVRKHPQRISPIR